MIRLDIKKDPVIAISKKLNLSLIDMFFIIFYLLKDCVIYSSIMSFLYLINKDFLNYKVILISL
jgi:hypothetical protein